MLNAINERLYILEKKKEEKTVETSRNTNGEKINTERKNQITPTKIPASQHLEKMIISSGVEKRKIPEDEHSLPAQKK